MDLKAMGVCYNSIEIFVSSVSIFNANFNRHYSPNCHSKIRRVYMTRAIVLDSNLIFNDLNDLDESTRSIKTSNSPIDALFGPRNRAGIWCVLLSRATSLYLSGVPIVVYAVRISERLDDTSKKKKRNKNLKLLSRRQQPSNWGRGLHPRHAPWLTPLESQHRLTQLTQHATHKSKTK